MTWSIDEAVSPLTQWSCSLCGYSAREDESRESTCHACGTEKSRLLLSDPNGSYWFCLNLPVPFAGGRRIIATR
jgi:hypothetical protein